MITLLDRIDKMLNNPSDMQVTIACVVAITIALLFV